MRIEYRFSKMKFDISKQNCETAAKFLAYATRVSQFIPNRYQTTTSKRRLHFSQKRK